MQLDFIYKKLVTKEDPFMIHKGLGVFVLIHYVYRYYLLFRYNNMFLSNPMGITCIYLHGLLSISSLIFHIPSVRNPKSPMIYPEFRAHSILFAMRSVLCCIVHYYSYSMYYTIGLNYITMMTADVITNKYNPNGKNGKTMRNMPFDEHISKEDQEEVTLMHSAMQIGATTYMLLTIDSAFSPMFAIQLAAFLMTLVRKNIITSRLWHILYAFSLWINIFIVLSPNITIDMVITQGGMFFVYKNYFFKYRWNKYYAWTLLYLFFVTKQKWFPNFVENVLTMSNLHNYGFNNGMRWMMILQFFYYNIISAKSLFIRLFLFFAQ